MKDFNSIEELYNHVLPALKIRAKELKKIGKNFDENHIWNHLIRTKWMKAQDLSLAEMINDILYFGK